MVKIIKNNFGLALIAGLLLIAFSPLSAFAAWHGKDLKTQPYFNHHTFKVIFQVPNNPKMWQLTVNNISNALNFSEKYGFRYKIIVAAYGPAIKMFIKKDDKKFYATLQSLNASGVKMAVCHQTMMGMHVTKAQLFDFADVMYPGGIFYIAKKEMQGYAYIKP